jgi:hypothetical protein
LPPQSVYYFHEIAQSPEARTVSTPSGTSKPDGRVAAKRAGLPIDRFVAATNERCATVSRRGRFEPRHQCTLANAMDVITPATRTHGLGDAGDVAAMRKDISGARITDEGFARPLRRLRGPATCRSARCDCGAA